MFNKNIYDDEIKVALACKYKYKYINQKQQTQKLLFIEES